MVLDKDKLTSRLGNRQAKDLRGSCIARCLRTSTEGCARCKNIVYQHQRLTSHNLWIGLECGL
jgi:hypothetical protein